VLSDIAVLFIVDKTASFIVSFSIFYLFDHDYFVIGSSDWWA